MTVIEISWNVVDGVAAVWYNKMKYTQNVHIYFADEWANQRTNELSKSLVLVSDYYAWLLKMQLKRAWGSV